MARSHLSPIATCRQTVEALFAPHHRLAADGYDSQRIATTTIHQRILFARQLMHDAVDWKIIEENPFLYPNFRTTEHTEHTEINPPPVMSCFRVFRVFRGSLALEMRKTLEKTVWHHPGTIC